MADYLPSSLTTENSTAYKTYLQESSNSAASAPNNAMDQADFLRLLTTQLQNQDPSKPMDPTQFVTDLTQMSQLEATTKMNESIITMTESFKNIQTMQAASIIGKNVQVSGEDFSHIAGQDSQIRLNLDQPLTDIKVVISDENGLVQEIEGGSADAGEKVIDWDGLDKNGNIKPDGVYSLTIYGSDEAGELKMIDSIVASRVNSVSVNTDGTMTLTLATGERISMNDVREISG